ncbi:MAG: nickel pincer cofactor biosynthesis protein LarC [Deltaproteobacteria bacterium]|nr:nickel pincer cofactor biosynthesis protein LarC [Deltaproteobacteria bacterium]
MRILYLDLVGGIAGDMAVAALLELGVPWELLQQGVNSLALPGVSIQRFSGQRHQISGTHFQVVVAGAGGENLEQPAQPVHAHSSHAHPPHSPSSHHHASHDHEHTTHEHRAGSASHAHRPYREIRELLEGSPLAQGPKALALALFRKLAEAEGAVHGVPPDNVTLHEVGALDAIVDVTCLALALDWLKPQVVYCSAVPLGRGMVRGAHGLTPVPSPAALNLLTGFPVINGGPAYEQTTPTGAALLAALARPLPPGSVFTPLSVGVGLGTLDPPDTPNLLRAVLADMPDAAAPAEEPPPAGLALSHARREWVELATANLDDHNPEWLGHLLERLWEEGVLDAALVPVQMKKNRAGTQLQVLYPPALRGRVEQLVFSETTTLGLRFQVMERAVLRREPRRVKTPWGEVEGKVGWVGDTPRFTPEYESARQAARRGGVDLPQVYRAAQRAFEDSEPE